MVLSWLLNPLSPNRLLCGMRYVGVIAEVQFLRKQGVYKMVRLPAPNLTEQYPEANE